jgi:hypothetical protein
MAAQRWQVCIEEAGGVLAGAEVVCVWVVGDKAS